MIARTSTTAMMAAALMMLVTTTHAVWTSTGGGDAELSIQNVNDGRSTAGSDNLACTSGLKTFNPTIHKKVYKIGVHAPDGEETAWMKFNMTFQDYLTATAGRRFVPPIEFEMVTTTTPIKDWVGQGHELQAAVASGEMEDAADHALFENQLDFFYGNAGVFTCVGTEVGAQPMGTTIADYDNLRAGLDYQLDVYSGVIFTRKDRRDIETIADLKDKIIAAQSIQDFAGAQAQFYQMQQEGLDYVMDPKQVVFGPNQEEIVRGVVSGDWDVGLVRTGILESQATDEYGRVLDPNMFKIINQRMHVLEDGTVFPFEHSTDIFPEWPFFSSMQTPSDVVEEVQNALQALGDHRKVGQLISYCKTVNCKGNSNASDCDLCDSASVSFFDPDARCDTTRELADLAWKAGTAGRHNGFRSPKSYFAVRNMQEAAGFLTKNDYGEWQCTRADTLYDALTCPTGFSRVTQEEFQVSCGAHNASCPDGYDCFCKPCTEAFVVREYVDEHTGTVHSMEGCSRQDQLVQHQNLNEKDNCASTEQTKNIIFRAYDNTFSYGVANVRAVMTIDGHFEEMEVTQVERGQFEFAFTYHKVTVGTLSVYVDDLLIPSMPVQVQVVPRNCEAEFGNRAPTDNGGCVCSDKSFEFGDNCMDAVAFAITICAILGAGVSLGMCIYVRRKRMSSDQLWLINEEELHFNDPVEVIGQGAFGVVVLATYRGTKVAIKRVIKPKKGSIGAHRGSVGTSGSFDGAPPRGSVDRLASMTVSVNSEDIDKQKIDDLPRASNVSFVESDPDLDDGDIEDGGGVDSFVSANPSVVSALDDKTGIRSGGGGRQSVGSRGSYRESLDLGFLSKVGGGPQTLWQKLFPWIFPNQELRSKVDLLGSSMGGGMSRAGVKAMLCPWFDKGRQQREDFMAEMRLLSKLRHPYITTVMGAVVSNFGDPMLVMEYMEYGSLYDLLRNETMYTGGDIILQIVRDVAQGLRFLHSSKPPIFHGDLKARNILIDSRFRAKVADFGLSTKKSNGLTGTPYFMAPEYLRRKSEYTAACDIYSLGIMFFEIYARDEPYKGEKMKSVLMKVCNPSINKRPQIPETMPPKFVEITKKCWSADPYYRPLAKDLDLMFMDMNQQDAEPLTREQISGKEKKNTMDMLYEVFPRHIADALKAGKKVEPEDHEMVTVFFSDIVGFTTISKQMSPSKVCDMLDRLYGEFDKLARAHQVFKVETIGDAYMGVTNLLGNQENEHVKNIAEFAVEAIHAANKIYIDEEDERLGTIKIRVGFHSGPVVSNVIGSLNPRYGLFGDTVNTASRMESNSIAGKIHCSEKSAKLLQKQAPDMKIRQRGKLAVKGKGDMVTYWVSSRRKKAEDPIEKLIDHKSFDCIVVADSLGVIKRVNKTAIRDFRYESEEEMVGLNVSDLVGGDIDATTHDAYLAAYHARDKEERTSTTLGRQRMLYARRKDGTQFQCIVGVNAVNDEALEEDMLVGYIRCLEMGDDSPAPAAAAGCPVKKETTAASGGCPVKHNQSNSKLETAPIEKAGESTAFIGDVEEVPLNDLPGVDKEKIETTRKNNGKSGLTSLQRAVKEVNAQKVADALEQAHNMVADDDFTSTGSTEGDDSNCNSNPDLLVSTSV